MERAWSRIIKAKLRAIQCACICFVIAQLAACTLAGRPAPELAGTKPINSCAPVRLSSLKGKIVVLDFWSYSCVNCLKTIAPLKSIEAKFKDDVVFVGVHSPKYNAEKPDACVLAAIRRYGIDNVVVNDADITAWRNYGVEVWPTFVVIDSASHIIHQFTGDNCLPALTSALSDLVEKEKSAGTLCKTAPLKVEYSASPTNSVLSAPAKICADASNRRLIISSTGTNQIVIVEAADKQPRVSAIIGDGIARLRNGNFKNCSFNHPEGITISQDKIYVADTDNHAIRQIDLKRQAVSTVLGDGTRRNTRVETELPAAQAKLDSPWDIIELKGKLYIAMAGAHQIWCFDPSASEISLVAGSGDEDLTDGRGAAARMAQPTGICTDNSFLYTADSEGNAVRKIDPTTGEVFTLVGKAMNICGDKDGTLKEALLQHPQGLAVSSRKLYVTDSFNHKIKVLDLADQTANTVCGSGSPGNEDGMFSSFSEPSGIAIMNDKLFIADTNNNAVRVVDLAQLSTATLNLKLQSAPAPR